MVRVQIGTRDLLCFDRVQQCESRTFAGDQRADGVAAFGFGERTVLVDESGSRSSVVDGSECSDGGAAELWFVQHGQPRIDGSGVVTADENMERFSAFLD